MIYRYLLRSHVYNRFNVKEITPPQAEQIDLATAREQLRLVAFGSPPEHRDDAWITENIPVAREWCESWSGRSLCVRTLELGLEFFPSGYAAGQQQPLPFFASLDHQGVLLPMPPLVQVVSVKYLDGDGTEQVMDPGAYYIDDYASPAVLYPIPGTTWPVAQFMRKEAVRIRYICGYSFDSDSPQLWPMPRVFRSAMLLVLGHLNENRENTSEVTIEEIPLGAQSLMEHYRVRLGMA